MKLIIRLETTKKKYDVIIIRFGTQFVLLAFILRYEWDRYEIRVSFAPI